MTTEEQIEQVRRATLNQISMHAIAEQGENLAHALRIIEKMVDAFAANQQVGYLTVGNAGTAKEESTK